MLENILQEKDYEVKSAGDVASAMLLLKSEYFHLIISDLQLPDVDGITFLKKIKHYNIPFIILTAFGSIELAVEAIKEGAFDFASKPIDPDYLFLIVEKALESTRILRENIIDPLSRTGSGTNFIYTSYPRENIKYPIITVKENGMAQIQRLGMQSEHTLMRMPIEVRVWARNEKEKDELSQNVYYFLKNNQLGTGSTFNNVELHDFTMTSAVNVNEQGEEAVKSKVMEFSWIYVCV